MTWDSSPGVLEAWVQPLEYKQAEPPECGRAATLLHCLAVHLQKHTAEENPGLCPKEKALLLSDKAALTPKECTIGNESWTENQFQQETGWSLLKLSSKIYHCNNREQLGRGAPASPLHLQEGGEGWGTEQPQWRSHIRAIRVPCHFNEILIHLCLNYDRLCFKKNLN